MTLKAIGDGSVIDLGVDESDRELDTLKAENRRLQRAVSDAERAAERAQEDAFRALSVLRRQLGPLYRALQAVFGELDAAGVAETMPTMTASAAGSADKWDEWKQRLGPGCAKVIDALLLGGEMSITAICVAAKMGKRTVYEATSKMGQAGIVARNGSKFSLKT
jgi:hypothetical protein